ncbi:SDR family oxidoreductase [Pseudomonas syringae]|nr:SDR family oxidoreductase [Pseudomonas syringae]
MCAHWSGVESIRSGMNVRAVARMVVEGEDGDGVVAMCAREESRPVGEKKRLVGEQGPFGRMGTAVDLTGMAIFLASADSEYVVAQTYNVDGGNGMSRRAPGAMMRRPAEKSLVLLPSPKGLAKMRGHTAA